MKLSDRKGFIVAVSESFFIVLLLTIGASISLGFRMQFLVFPAMSVVTCFILLMLDSLFKVRTSVVANVAAISGVYMFVFAHIRRDAISSILVAFTFYLFIYFLTDRYNKKIFR